MSIEPMSTQHLNDLTRSMPPRPAAIVAAAPVPTIGRIVLYTLTEANAEAINARRQHAAENRNKVREEKPGFQAHIGNECRAGQEVPMIIVATWYGDTYVRGSSHVNGQAFLDGNDVLWLTSVSEGTGPGWWRWPPRV